MADAYALAIEKLKKGYKKDSVQRITRPNNPPPKTVEEKKQVAKRAIRKAEDTQAKNKKAYRNLVAGTNTSSTQKQDALNKYSTSLALSIIRDDEEASEKVLQDDEVVDKLNSMNRQVAIRSVETRKEAKKSNLGRVEFGVEFTFDGNRVNFRLMRQGRTPFRDHALCVGAVFDPKLLMSAMVVTDGTPATGWMELDDEDLATYVSKTPGANSVLFIWSGKPGLCPEVKYDYCACIPVGQGVSCVPAFSPKVAPRGFNTRKDRVPDDLASGSEFLDLSSWFVPHSQHPFIAERDARQWLPHIGSQKDQWQQQLEQTGRAETFMSKAANFIAVAESIRRLDRDLLARVVPSYVRVPGVMMTSRIGVSEPYTRFHGVKRDYVERATACFKLFNFAKQLASVGVCMDFWGENDLRFTSDKQTKKIKHWVLSGLSHASMIVVRGGQGNDSRSRLNQSTKTLISVAFFLMGGKTVEDVAAQDIFTGHPNLKLEAVTALIKLQTICENEGNSGNVFEKLWGVWNMVGKEKAINVELADGVYTDKETGLELDVVLKTCTIPSILIP